MINFRKVSGFSSEEVSRLISARILVNIVLVSDDFKKKVLGFKFATTNDSPEEVMGRISQPWLINISIVTPPFWKRWISQETGHECADGCVVLDRDKYACQSIPEIADTIIHEACHVAGYRHISEQDVTSVPYALGTLTKEVSQELLTENNVPDHLAAITSTNS